MTDLASMLFNLAILGGYLFASFYIGPRVQGTRTFTKIMGSLFFLTCGLHHAEGAALISTAPSTSVESMLARPHMLVIDGVQAVSIWGFVVGLAVDFIVRPLPKVQR